MSLAPIPSRLYPRCVGTPLPMATQAHREPTFLLVQILEKQHLASNAVKGNNQVVYHGLGPRYQWGQLDDPQQAGGVGNPLDNPLDNPQVHLPDSHLLHRLEHHSHNRVAIFFPFSLVECNRLFQNHVGNHVTREATHRSTLKTVHKDTFGASHVTGRNVFVKLSATSRRISTAAGPCPWLSSLLPPLRPRNFTVKPSFF